VLNVLIPLAGYWLVLIYQLGAQWSAYEQYNYGWAVPFLCFYLIWDRLKGRNVETLKVEMLKRGLWSRSDFSVSAFQRFSVLLLLLLLLPVRLLHEANPIWRLTSLAWALILVTVTLALVWRAGGWPWLRHLGPPVGFFLVAVPWPTPVESGVTQGLMRLNVGITVEVLQFLGIPALQKGNVVELATGLVGVEEACSGIRSLQATLMIGLFFGMFYRLSWRRAAALVLGGVALAFSFNVVRTSLLSWVAARQGTAAIAKWHDPAGVAILVGCFVALWLLALGLQRGGKARMEDGKWKMAENCAEGGREAQKTPSSILHSPSSTFRWALGLLLWLIVVEAGTELWFRVHEKHSATAQQWSVSIDGLQPPAERIEIPPSISGQFNADNSLHARWEDGAGNPWQLYYFRWHPAHSLSRRVAVQLAKTHGPEKCLPAAGMTLDSYLGVITVPVGGRKLAFQQYVFIANGAPLHVFYAIYEDPSGTATLANRRQTSVSRLAAALAGSRNYGQRYLELAVSGLEDPQAARAALSQQLERLVRLDATAKGEARASANDANGR
jgi:exosortase